MVTSLLFQQLFYCPDKDFRGVEEHNSQLSLSSHNFHFKEAWLNQGNCFLIIKVPSPHCCRDERNSLVLNSNFLWVVIMNSGFVRKYLKAKFNLSVAGFTPTQWPRSGWLLRKLHSFCSVLKPFEDWSPVMLHIMSSGGIFFKEVLRARKGKEKEKKGKWTKQETKRERDHFWAVTSSLHYSLLIPHLVWAFMGFLSHVIILSPIPPLFFVLSAPCRCSTALWET